MRTKRITFACPEGLEERLNSISELAKRSRSFVIASMLSGMVDYIEARKEELGEKDFEYLVKSGRDKFLRSLDSQVQQGNKKKR